jgi:hypothetical protein
MLKPKLEPECKGKEHKWRAVGFAGMLSGKVRYYCDKCRQTKVVQE